MERPFSLEYLYVPLVSPVYRRVKRNVLKRYYAGRGVHCPLCNYEARSWVRKDPHGRCASCGSSSRQRLMWLLLTQFAEPVPKLRRLLYFAPDECLLERLQTLVAEGCTTADLSRPDVDVKADITRLPFADASYDAVICCHVLEHVQEDATAMRELHRVLKPGGIAWIQVPLASERAHTDEAPWIIDPNERKRRFGQFDHVRTYGLDIEQRLAAAGFEVRPENPVRELSKHLARRWGVWDDTIYRCQRPTRHSRDLTALQDIPSAAHRP